MHWLKALQLNIYDLIIFSKTLCLKKSKSIVVQEMLKWIGFNLLTYQTSQWLIMWVKEITIEFHEISSNFHFIAILKVLIFNGEVGDSTRKKFNNLDRVFKRDSTMWSNYGYNEYWFSCDLIKSKCIMIK